jgi:hypothetical protein
MVVEAEVKFRSLAPIRGHYGRLGVLREWDFSTRPLFPTFFFDRESFRVTSHLALNARHEFAMQAEFSMRRIAPTLVSSLLRSREVRG